MQAGFIGLMEAAKAWEPERGAWSNIAMLYIKREMRKTVGLYGKRVRAEHNAIALDAPIATSGDMTRLDLLEDEQMIDEHLLADELQRHVHAAVDGMKDACTADIIRRFDLKGQTYEQISNELGMERHQSITLRRKGLNELRRNKRLRTLLDERTPFYAHKGVRAFNSDWTSTTEAAALWRLEYGRR